MYRLRRFLELDREGRVLVLRALGWIVAVRLALTLAPFRSVRRGVDRFAERTGRRRDRSTSARIGWAVEAVAPVVPHATCLTQALAAHLMLRRDDHPSALRLGVARPEGGTALEAHAWVESDGVIVVGDHDVHRFSLLEGPGGS